MKFAKKFQKVLAEETLPDEWVQKAIQYKSLKKIINKTVTELESVGVSRDDMAINYEISKVHRQVRPIMRMNVSPLAESVITDKLESLGYNYDVKPLNLHSEEDHDDDNNNNDDDNSNDNKNGSNGTGSAALPSIKVDLENDSAAKEGKQKVEPADLNDLDMPTQDDKASVETSIEESAATYLHPMMNRAETLNSTTSSITSAVNPFDDKPYYEITVFLHEDAKFFQMLYEEIEALNNFTDRRENEIMGWVENIASIVAKASSPEVKRNDLYVWREIFLEYTESQIFFSTIERSAGLISNSASKLRYGKFLEKIEQRKLVNKFRRKESLEAFMEFKDLNESILKVSNFQALNIMAISKILKKFDKRTHFKTKQLFPELMEQSEKIDILQNSMGKDICSIMANHLLNIVPQVDDYLCPICCSVAYKPIRLDCGHVFCVRCLVKLQRKGDDRCPLCRKNVVLKADEHNLDVSRMVYLKMYFPKEVKQKQSENEKEVVKEHYANVIDPDAKGCVIM